MEGGYQSSCVLQDGNKKGLRQFEGVTGMNRTGFAVGSIVKLHELPRPKRIHGDKLLAQDRDGAGYIRFL